MALQKTLVPLDFTQGVDTKTDEKLGAKPSTIENGVFSEKKSLTRRPGNALADNLTSLGLGSNGFLATLEDQLLARDDSSLHGRVSGALRTYGSARPYITRKRHVVRGNTTKQGADQGALNGVVLYAWVDYDNASTYTMRFTTMDESTGVTHMVPYTEISGGRCPKVIVASDRLLLFYIDGANLRMITVLPSTPTTYTLTATIRTDSRGNNLDAVLMPNGNIGISYANTSNQVTGLVVNTSGVVQSGPTNVGTATAAVNCWHINAFSGNNLLFVWVDLGGSNSTMYAIRSSTLTSVVAATAWHSAVQSTAATSYADSSNNITLFTYDGTDGLQVGVITSTGVISTARALVRRLAFPMTAPFMLNGDLLIGVADGRLQFMGTLCRYSAGALSVVGVMAHGSSLSHPGVNGSGSSGFRFAKPRLKTYTDGSWPVVLWRETSHVAFSGGFQVITAGISEIEIRRDTAGFDVDRNRLKPAQYGRSLYFPGAMLRQFDGKATYEAGFIHYPAISSLTAAAGAGLSAGVYQYCAVYEFVDANGDLHRSAPSTPQSVTIAAGANQQATFNVTNLYMTEKVVGVAIYRTEANGTTFYRQDSPATAKINSTSTQYTAITDAVPDATIRSNEPLYTTGAGQLESIIAPPSVFVHAHGSRLFSVNAEDRTVVDYSDQRREGYGPSFNEACRISGGPEGGEIVGLGSIDEKLVFLREEGLQFISGDGPDRAGLQNTFTTPQFITSDTGCKSAASIVQTPDGVMFEGERGIYLLNRGLQLVHIGEEVEELTGRISCAVHLPQKSQVRFACPEDERSLCYDYANRQWSVFTGLAIDAMVVLNGTLYSLTRAGLLLQESAAAAGDSGTPFSMVVVTPWLKLAGIQGFQRVWRALFLGTIKGHSTVTIEIGYDFAADYSTTVTVNTADLGEADEVFKVQKHLDQQKCESIRFRITCDGSDAGTASLGLALSNLTLEVGAKRGARKLPAAQTI